MKITVCGSTLSDELIQSIQSYFSDNGHDVVVSDNNRAAKASINTCVEAINVSDAILVINEKDGSSERDMSATTFMAIAHAYTQGLEIFVLNPVADQKYAEEIDAMQPIILNGNLNAITDYYGSLPLALVSSESPVKHSAVSRAFRRAGIRVRVDGVKVNSGVNEQPMTIDETYQGATTRHDYLVNLARDAAYYVTIESGQHPAHKNHSLFGCGVFIVEKQGKDRKIGIDLDIEFPQAMLDKVPSHYPDLGVLVQKEYGAAVKDPYPYFTNNKLTRAYFLENALYSLLVRED
jgi:non-canonical (house-cleaning) NTP pyrophosphatase